MSLILIALVHFTFHCKSNLLLLFRLLYAPKNSITAQFKTWIEDSRVNQLDDETQKMIAEMKRKVARHRWKRAISAVRLSYKLAGKPPKFENPVVAPGCENQNRFVDMNEMMSEAMRSQPKYFREGSVMHNLIESGIELVWFSDVSQNDVVYGICVQREEKKVTVVFRGTVRLFVLFIS